ncbi:MAG: hypothetical protein FVQ82_10805 [Planctomycetes bacterium]|nr:hypothetical protein [Planctomycetota bacterium]
MHCGRIKCEFMFLLFVVCLFVVSGFSGEIDKEYDYLAAQIKQKPVGDRHERLEKEVLGKEALILKTDRDPLDVVLRRTRALLDDLGGMDNAPDLDREAVELSKFTELCKTIPIDDTRRKEYFTKVCSLRRKIAFSNPLLDFDKLVFAKRKVLGPSEGVGNHMCDQYFGFYAIRGGGVFILDDIFGKAKVRNVIADSVCVNGRFKGKKLENGSFLSPDLSFDGKTIVFAWTEAEPTKRVWTERSTFHIFKVNVDGSNLTQLTDGKWNDFDPCFLPNGRIVFISERRGGFGRCHGRPVPTYTLHSMRDDGSDIIAISSHETNEWHPSVDNNGMIVYSRWDYVDRDSDIAHHIWLTYPDGRDPRSYHGNYPVKRESRPWMEMSVRAVPGSHKYIAVSSPHHGQNYGSLVMIDHRIEDDNSMSQVKRVTPEVHLPESEKSAGWSTGNIREQKGHARKGHVFSTPWPLSEDYYICVYDSQAFNHGIYLVDSFGNRELLYRDDSISCIDPIPLQARAMPEIIPSRTMQAAEDRIGKVENKGTIAVTNVYDSDFDWPKGTKIKALRVIQLFPKATPNANKPNIGLAAQSLCRGVLGTVPVETDGSAYFEAPADIPMYFQALDEKGMAVMNMRSNTYVHAGEQLTCQGCHEPKLRTVSSMPKSRPLALMRGPSKLKRDVDGSYPVLYPRLVQPVIDKKCIGCHSKKEKAPNLSTEIVKHGWTQSFMTLSKYGWGKSGGNGAIRGNKGSRSVIGDVGAGGSKLYKMLKKGHHDVKLTDEEMYRITLWLDCNTNFYGAYRDTDKQAKGEVVMPEIF